MLTRISTLEGKGRTITVLSEVLRDKQVILHYAAAALLFKGRVHLHSYPCIPNGVPTPTQQLAKSGDVGYRAKTLPSLNPAHIVC